ncbi:MAG: TonB-dependent receptor domain-containing protein [Acidobacteriota bacterium]
MERGRLLILLFALVLVVPVLSTQAMAQAVYGSISGTVTDASGGVVPGATVTITDVRRGTTVEVITNDSGNYVKDRLLPGVYSVKVTLTGFQAAVIERVNVSVDTDSHVDVMLQPGGADQIITVESTESQLLKTDRADVATTFDDRQITDLPILDRNFTKFILLTPGTQQLGWQHAASENPQGSIQTMVNGQHFSGTGYQLDGTENRDPILGIIVINPNFEAIGETKITSQNYDAEFGQAIAGVVSVQTKSGTNAFHGSAFDFRQSDWGQARNPFAQSEPNAETGRFIPATLRNQFGGSFGGPIIKDKFFFFGDYQGLRSKVGGSRLLTVPTALARTGDLSEYGVNIFDPAGGVPANRTQFAGNIIPQARLSPQALAILQLIPQPTRPGIRDNFVASGIEKFDNNTFDVRLDGRMSENFNLFGRYSLADFERDGPTAFGAGGGAELVSLGGVSDVRNHSLATGFDYSMTPTWISDFRFGWFWYKVNVLPFDFGQKTGEQVGIPGVNLDDTTYSGLPAGFVEGPVGGFNFGSGLGVNRCNCPLDQDEKQFQWVGNILKIAGNHQVKFGTDVRRAYNLRVPSDRHRSGEFTFRPDVTRGPEGGGLGLATFLLGEVSRFTRYVSPSTNARERQWRHFYYAQDTWRVTQKLTLSYGLRLDIINPQTINEPGNGGFLNLSTGEIMVAGVGDIDLAGNVENSLNWAPRLGIAYQATDSTVIRAGYGRSYDIGVFGSLFGHSVTQNLPVLSAQELDAPNNFESVFTLAQGPPAPVFPAVPPNGRFPLPPGVFAFALPDKQRLPTVDAYNLMVQHQLNPSLSIEAGYVGNKGTHVFAGDGPDFNVNQATIEGFPTLSQDQRKPFFSRFGWTQSISFFCNCADNHYDSFQTKLNKRFSEGYSVLAHYTWQKVTQEGGDYFVVDPSVSRGRPDWDRRHNFVFTQLAELPFGRGRRFASDMGRMADLILGGWQINSTTTIQSGLPFTPSYRDCGADRDVGPCRPDVLGDVEIIGDQNNWFNTTPIGSPGSVFARPQVGRFGNIGRNTLTGPGYWRTDASLFKHFHFTEVSNLEFRFEVFNLFNHVNLGQPDAEIGIPGNLNTNAGRITSTAYGGTDPMRQLQFALKLNF